MARLKLRHTGVYLTDYEVQYSTDLVVWAPAPIGSGDNTVLKGNGGNDTIPKPPVQ